MCRIDGYSLCRIKKSIVLNKIREALIHRGHDDSSAYENKPDGFGLVHIRLAFKTHIFL